MSRSIVLTALVATLLVSTASFAQAPAGAPAGATGTCKDGSYSTGATKKGACRGHKGVQDWYASADGAGAAPVAPNGKMKHGAKDAAAAVATPAAPVIPAAPAAAVTKPSYTPPATAAPGGGAGQVWANKGTKVYHCPSDRWYGKTKEGAYMSEADAKAQGYRADHGKACQS